MSLNKKSQITYILENMDAKIGRRFYIGRTISLERRMKEHQKDGRQNYRLVFSWFGNIEKELKGFGAVRFMALSEWDRQCVCAFYTGIKRIKNKNGNKKTEEV